MCPPIRWQGCTEEENAQALDLGQSFCADKGLPLNTVVTLGCERRLPFD